MSALDDFPFTTVAAIAGIVVVVLGYLSNDLSLQDALLYLGIYEAGTAAVGEVRNRAGKGLRK